MLSDHMWNSPTNHYKMPNLGIVLSLYQFLSRNVGKNPEIPSTMDLSQVNEMNTKLHTTPVDSTVTIRPPPTSSFYEKYQWEIWNCFEQEIDTKVGRFINFFFISVILLSVFLLIVETEEYFTSNTFISAFFYIGELFTLVVFTFEFCLRLWACVASRFYRGLGGIFGRIRFLISLWSILDLIALVPSFIYLGITTWDLLLGGSSHGIRLASTIMFFLRTSRFIRIFRMNKFTQGIGFFWNVLKAKYRELMITFTLLFTTLTIFAFVMYTVEKGTQPVEFGSIPRTFYFTFVSMTTIGYGDIVPKTILGKIILSGASLFPIIFFAVPTSIIGAGFIDEIQRSERADHDIQQAKSAPKDFVQFASNSVNIKISCPHCKCEINKSIQLHGIIMEEQH